MSAWDHDSKAWDRVATTNRQEGPQVTRSAQDGAFFVSVQTLPPAAPYPAMGKVEWNPSRVVDPDGWGVAEVGEALVTTGRAAVVAQGRMFPKWDVTDWNVKRLDVTRDFSLDEGAPGEIIRALAAVHRPWSRKNLVHADAQRNGAQTLMVGSKAGVTRLYDKHAESHGAAPEGTVRWETEARSDWCQRYGEIGSVCDVSSLSVEVLAVNRFEWSGMGCEVSTSTSHLVHRINTCDQLGSERERSGFGWFLVQQAAGVSPELSSATLAKYRRLQRDLGIVASDLAATVEVVRRLDWDSGKEVLRVA